MVTQVSNKPTNLTMQNFLSKVNALGGPAKGCRFVVRITPRISGGGNNILTALPYISKIGDLTYVCDAVEFPGRGFGVSNFRQYGPSQVVPNNTEYGPCNLSLLCNNVGFERQFFDDWQNIINPTNSFNFNYPKEYYCDVEIFQLSEYGQTVGAFDQATTFGQISMIKTPEVIYNWKLHMAWPTFVSPQQVTWADNSDVLRLQITLAYKYWDRPGNDTFFTRSSSRVNNPAADLITNYLSRQ